MWWGQGGDGASQTQRVMKNNNLPSFHFISGKKKSRDWRGGGGWGGGTIHKEWIDILVTRVGGVERGKS